MNLLLGNNNIRKFILNGQQTLGVNGKKIG